MISQPTGDDGRLSSKFFNVHTAPDFASANARITVVVDESARTSDVQLVHKSLECWREVGMSGGFGGTPFDNSSAFSLVAAAHTFRCWIDFGSSDIELALRVLIWICESVDSRIAIDELRLEPGTLDDVARAGR